MKSFLRDLDISCSLNKLENKFLPLLNLQILLHLSSIKTSLNSNFKLHKEDKVNKSKQHIRHLLRPQQEDLTQERDVELVSQTLIIKLLITIKTCCTFSPSLSLVMLVNIKSFAAPLLLKGSYQLYGSSHQAISSESQFLFEIYFYSSFFIYLSAQIIRR